MRKVLILSTLVYVSLTLNGQTQNDSARTLFLEASTAAETIQTESERQFAYAELVEAQARAGLVEDAIRTATKLGADRYLFQQIAKIQISRGEYSAALETIKQKSRGIHDLVLEDIGIEQAKRGRTSDALATAGKISNPYYAQSVLYFVALELARQARLEDARAVAARLKDFEDLSLSEKDLQQATTSDWRIPKPPPRVSNSPESPVFRAKELLNRGDVRAAIREIERRPNSADVSSDFSHLAEYAAESGQLEAARAFADKSLNCGYAYGEGYLVAALPSIGRLWAGKNLNDALDWARTRPTAYQKTMALIGVAEGAVVVREGSAPSK